VTQSPIEDYYGVEIRPESVMTSVGPMVDIDLTTKDGPEFLRLSPSDARQLGLWLVDVVMEHDDQDKGR
jgi:hypothetical protein